MTHRKAIEAMDRNNCIAQALKRDKAIPFRGAFITVNLNASPVYLANTREYSAKLSFGHVMWHMEYEQILFWAWGWALVASISISFTRRRGWSLIRPKMISSFHLIAVAAVIRIIIQQDFFCVDKGLEPFIIVKLVNTYKKRDVFSIFCVRILLLQLLLLLLLVQGKIRLYSS